MTKLIAAVALSLLAVAAFLIVRLGLLIQRIRAKRASFARPPTSEDNNNDNIKAEESNTTTSKKNDPLLKTMVVLGSGGHTTEMIQLIKNLSPQQGYQQPFIFVKAATDSTSVDRLQGAGLVVNDNIIICNIPRAREVGQSYLSSIFTTLYSFWYAIQLVGRVQPDLLLCNGPGTCLPLCVAALCWRVLSLSLMPQEQFRVIFIESYCRVQTMSLTGRILYPWADLCAVHWPSLQQKYPLTQCISTMIRHDDNVDIDSENKKRK